ncbi:MAG: corrinoid protein [Dehalococcoidia bacterium]
MPSDEITSKLIKDLYDAVVNMDEETAVATSNAILKEGVDAYKAVKQGLNAAMDKVGVFYANQEYFVPELLLCSDALYAALDILKPHIKTEETEVKGKIIIGVVEGDIHDIGKNLVKIMFDAAGWTVYDLGKDVNIQKFAEENEKLKSDVVALSALMTTSMLAMPRIIELVRAKDPKVAIMVGGAPLTQEIAKSYGADGYAADATKAVEEAARLVALSKG